MLLRAVDADHRLDAWELDFVTSLTRKGQGYELSDNENHKLTEINSKVQWK